MTDSLSISWHSYPQVYALGHKYLQFLLSSTVIIEEKIDGSQFSFGRFGDHLRLKSKGKEIIVLLNEILQQLKTIACYL
jgi:hypothetical protein